MMPSRSQVEQRARSQFGNPNRGASSKSDLRFGKKGSISVCLDGDKRGLWFDHEAQEGGSLLSGNEIPERASTMPRTRFEHDTNSAVSFQHILGNLHRCHGTAAEMYLLRRGITEWPDHSIKFCRSPFGLCALAQDADGAVRACQIVYLTDDGRKRPSLSVVKRTHIGVTNWHEIAAVRMPGRGQPILCEGVETGLSLWMATTRPVFACLGIAGLGALRLRAQGITIARDGDEPGSKADLAVQRAIGRRRSRQKVRVATPPEGMDFNDVLRRDGVEEIARILRNAS